MPPTEEEIAAIGIVLDRLGETGPRWEVREYLDDKLPNESTPEAIATDGVKTAAIEVKRLIVHGDFFGLKDGLEALLLPTTAGHYVLIPPFGYPLPWAKDFIRIIRNALERSATELDYGESGAIRVPRFANIAQISQSGSHAYCTHGPSLLRQLAGSLPGVFYLVDTDQRHSFVTQGAEAEFRQRVLAGCERRAAGNVVQLEWFEEWPLQRLAADESRVEIVMPTPVFEVQPTIDERVWIVLESGGRKFRTRRADSNILVIDSRFVLGDADRVASAIERGRDGQWAALIDLVFLLDRDACQEVFRAAR
jgi:hypothetical protein